MAATYSPPVHAKKEKKSVMPIVLGVVAGLALAGLVFVFLQLKGQKAENAELKGVVLHIAETIGSDKVSASNLTSEATAAAALEALTNAVSEKMTALTTARADLEAAQAEAATVKADSEAAILSASDARSQLDTARADLTARTDELAKLKKSYSNESERLLAVIAELNSRTAESTGDTAAGETAENADPAAGETTAAAATSGTATSAAAGTNGVAGVSTSSSNVVRNLTTVIPPKKALVFKSVRYDEKHSKMILLTVDGKTLTYSDVPGEIYDGLVSAPIFDVYFRFKVMDTFASQPNDRELIRTVKY